MCMPLVLLKSITVYCLLSMGKGDSVHEDPIRAGAGRAANEMRRDKPS